MKAKILALLLLWVSLSASAQSFAVVINNPEDADFHFVLDPPELKSFDPSTSIFASVVYDYFAESPSEAAGASGFQQLPSGATRRLENLSEGTHLIAGFFALPNRSEFPVRVMQIKAGGGMSERFYSIYTEPSLFRAKAGRGRLSAFPGPAMGLSAAAPKPSVPAKRMVLQIKIDNQYQDWEAIPALKSFGADFQPGSFSREQFGGGFEALPLSQSHFWQKAGTSLSELKAVEDGDSIFLFISTSSAIADGLSVYLYFYDRREPEPENRVTVELLPASGEKPAVAALWEKDRKPVLAGTVASSTFFMEAELPKMQLLQALPARPDVIVFDLTSAYFDRIGLVYEEFYFTTLSLKDIPTP